MSILTPVSFVWWCQVFLFSMDNFAHFESVMCVGRLISNILQCASFQVVLWIRCFLTTHFCRLRWWIVHQWYNPLLFGFCVLFLGPITFRRKVIIYDSSHYQGRCMWQQYNACPWHLVLLCSDLFIAVVNFMRPDILVATWPWVTKVNAWLVKMPSCYGS